ncbi:MAG: hypothetical protein ACRYFS_25605 [Janthinobacterium lividum]
MTTPFAKCKPLLFATLGVLSTVGVLSLTHVGPTQAQSPGVSLASLVARLNADEATITSQTTTISILRSQEQSDIKNVQNQQKNDEKQEQNDIKDVQTQQKNDEKQQRNDIMNVQSQQANDETKQTTDEATSVRCKP